MHIAEAEGIAARPESAIAQIKGNIPIVACFIAPEASIDGSVTIQAKRLQRLIDYKRQGGAQRLIRDDIVGLDAHVVSQRRRGICRIKWPATPIQSPRGSDH